MNQTIDELKSLGIDSTIVSGSVDSDFIELATCRCYIPTITGFGWLAASINPNEVYWDIQNPPHFDYEPNRKYRSGLVKGYNHHLKIKK